MKHALMAILLVCVLAGSGAVVEAQSVAGQTAVNAAIVSAPVTVPADYVMGPGDVLSIVFWRDKDMSADVVVRPDGKISLPLLNEIDAAGRTPEQLRAGLATVASKILQDPNVTVVVKEIHSRVVYITGSVVKAGPYPLLGDLSVLQLIAMAGGLAEYADSKNIVILRKQNSKDTRFKFNYKDVVSQKSPKQNIQLMPGDTVVVP
jgi:polysaccharide biosynthesis/export protein